MHDSIYDLYVYYTNYMHDFCVMCNALRSKVRYYSVPSWHLIWMKQQVLTLITWNALMA